MVSVMVVLVVVECARRSGSLRSESGEDRLVSNISQDFFKTEGMLLKIMFVVLSIGSRHNFNTSPPTQDASIVDLHPKL